jgi:hypothetical protein
MNKIFQIGFNKCGTVSMHKFFEANRLKSVHWDKGRLAQRIQSNFISGLPLLSGYENYDCFTDMESQSENIFIYLTLFKELDRQYPNSKFILNIRNRDNWIESRLNHRNYLEISQKLFNTDKDGVIDIWINDWERHISGVKEYFKCRPEDLLIFDIENESNKLFDFISKIINLRSKDFGQYNKTKFRKC